MLVPCCSECGSTEVRSDAYAEWDIVSQQWVLLTEFDNTDCEKCGGECSISWRKATPAELHEAVPDIKLVQPGIQLTANGAVVRSGDYVLARCKTPEGAEFTQEHQAPQLAQLFAAAPDLLAALESCLPYVPGWKSGDFDGRPWLVAAAAAIAKGTKP